MGSLCCCLKPANLCRCLKPANLCRCLKPANLCCRLKRTEQKDSVEGYGDRNEGGGDIKERQSETRHEDRAPHSRYQNGSTPSPQRSSTEGTQRKTGDTSNITMDKKTLAMPPNIGADLQEGLETKIPGQSSVPRTPVAGGAGQSTPQTGEVILGTVIEGATPNGQRREDENTASITTAAPQSAQYLGPSPDNSGDTSSVAAVTIAGGAEAEMEPVASFKASEDHEAPPDDNQSSQPAPTKRTVPELNEEHLRSLQETEVTHTALVTPSPSGDRPQIQVDVRGDRPQIQVDVRHHLPR
ncbi:hypothetical protein OBBRIDRAFT_200548 [Obba rivulosa]|uniref:Uncharacterized protein n=1 Tax=Obba rivulosa TaxID=1052685 RepID=A0A8E2AP40_9APHY|nr:hypothetical protein OBBRIDRAFT_200548 [Obba rivulosa]